MTTETAACGAPAPGMPDPPAQAAPPAPKPAWHAPGIQLIDIKQTMRSGAYLNDFGPSS
jgi:hypothetical protein